MATNQYLPFATAGGANVLAPADYSGLAARLAGFTAGTALSVQLNSVWRQSSVMAAMIGQFINDVGGFDALDDGVVANLATSFERSLQNGKLNFVAAAGTANAIVATLAPAPAALTVGMRLWLSIPSANTSATVTLNVNGLGAVGVVRRNLAFLAAGDIQPGISEFIYDGTYWRLANPAYASSSRQRSGFNGLIGTAVGGAKTASWAIAQICAGNGVLSYLGNNISIGFNGGTTGVGGMDTGATPVSGDLSIYAIYNPGANTWATLGTLASTSSGLFYTGSNAPAGYTVSCLLWSGVTDSSGNLLAMRQVDRRIYLNAAGCVVATGLSASSFANLSGLETFVPANATAWYARGIQTSNGNPSNIYVSPVAADAPGTMTTWSGVNNSAGDTLAIPLVAQKTAYYRITASQTWSISCQGYDI